MLRVALPRRAVEQGAETTTDPAGVRLAAAATPLVLANDAGARTYAVDLAEAKLDWDPAEARPRALAADAELDRAAARMRWHLGTALLYFALVAYDAWAGQGQERAWLVPASLALVLMRISVLSRLTSAALACAASSRGLPVRGVQIVLSVVVPLYNFFMPFRLLRRLVRASSVADLPRIRTVVEVPGTATYRSIARRVVVDETPRAPSSPILVVWQTLFVVTHFVRTGFVAIALLLACLGAELFVFWRIQARFRARVAHLLALDDVLKHEGPAPPVT